MKTPHPIHGDTHGSLKYYENRRLEGGLNVLADVCSDAAKILDVGCGPGTITIDVAGLVPNGTVVGVDGEKSAIERAKRTALEQNVSNIDFLVGDVFALPFEDGHFDATYSNMLLEWIDEPVEAIRQMARVTKPGGTIVARNNDYATVLFYPSMPYLEKWWSSLGYFRDHGDKPQHGSRWRGRELYTLFTRANLSDVYVTTEAPNPACHGTDTFGNLYQRLQNHLNPKHAMGVFSTLLIEAGILSEEDLANARQEAVEWSGNPEAFGCWPVCFTAVGIVPS